MKDEKGSRERVATFSVGVQKETQNHRPSSLCVRRKKKKKKTMVPLLGQRGKSSGKIVGMRTLEQIARSIPTARKERRRHATEQGNGHKSLRKKGRKRQRCIKTIPTCKENGPGDQWSVGVSPEGRTQGGNKRGFGRTPG